MQDYCQTKNESEGRQLSVEVESMKSKNVVDSEVWSDKVFSIINVVIF